MIIILNYEMKPSFDGNIREPGASWIEKQVHAQRILNGSGECVFFRLYASSKY